MSIRKRIVSVVIVGALAVCMAIPAFAASMPYSAVRMQNVSSGRMLNASTSVSVINSITNVTTYPYSGHITQAWLELRRPQDGDRCLIATAATNQNTANHNLMYVLNLVHSSRNCNLVKYQDLVQAGDAADALIYVVNEGGDRRGIVSKDTTLGTLCLSDSGGNAMWLAPNGQTNQLWDCFFAEL